MVGFFLLLLLIDFYSIKSSNWEHSTVHRLVFGNQNRSTAHGRPIRGLAVRQNGILSWLWLEEIPDEVHPWEVPGALLGVEIFRDLTRAEGFYHLTRRTEEVFIGPDSLHGVTRRQVMQAVLDAFDRIPEYEASTHNVGSLFRDGITRRKTSIKLGYIRNTIAALLASTAIFCFVYGKTWQWFSTPRDWVERKRTAEGRCPHCGYDLEGLAHPSARQVKCPECGQHIPIVARDQPG